MGKHAYLILAHKYDDLFKTIMKIIDYPENDIFLHMDIKCKEYNPEENVQSLKFSRLFHTKRTDITWGGYSLIRAEFLLLELATREGSYDYYHLISGQDLPLMKQEEIHKKLEGDTKEYIEVIADKIINPERVRYFHFIKNKGDLKSKLIRDRKFSEFQRKCGICRNRNLEIRKGSQWFSITDDLARYILSKKRWTRRKFRFSVASDELFVQTIIWGTAFAQRLEKDPNGSLVSINKREIDWPRGNGMNPYVYRMEDLELLKNSNAFFARKFDANIDMDIINEIYRLYGPVEE